LGVRTREGKGKRPEGLERGVDRGRTGKTGGEGGETRGLEGRKGEGRRKGRRKISSPRPFL